MSESEHNITDFRQDARPGSRSMRPGSKPGSDVKIIDWIPSTKESRTAKVHAIRYGVKCNSCGHFEDYKTRYCSMCGGQFLGEVPQFAKKVIHIWRRQYVKN